jgi:hypothetical protein
MVKRTCHGFRDTSLGRRSTTLQGGSKLDSKEFPSTTMDRRSVPEDEAKAG